ncbi:MAG: DUF937 domain-containing protein [Saprospiraceae bacterium]|nr:DUF937 domain-containing protein [Saprospiraceae bacterium]
MDLMKMLQDQMNNQVLGQISQQIGASEDQTATATQGIFTALVGGLANNTSSGTGLNSLLSALDRDHDGSSLDDIMGFVGGMMSGTASGNQANGMGILGHILGNKQEAVAQNISQKSGLDLSQIMKLMPILAPVVMSVLGKLLRSGGNAPQAQAAPSGGAGQIIDLASILMGSAQSAQGGAFGDLLGNVIGGVLSGGQPAANQSSGGGLFGKLLGTLFKR